MSTTTAATSPSRRRQTRQTRQIRPSELTREEWQDRAIERARALHLLYRGFWLTAHALNALADLTDAEWFAVPSSSRASLNHHVVLNGVTGGIRCDCEAGRYGSPCGHAGAVAWWHRQLRSAFDPAAQSATAREAEYFAWWEEHKQATL